ncbi:MAG: AI-2E family transporter [Candidatus Woesebacteria bacterium]|jgi:predicted PurR-regulated permease PerM
MFNFFHHKKKQVEISPSIVVFSAFFLLFLYFLYYISSIITLLFLSFIIMIALNGAVAKIEKRFKINRLFSVIFIYILVVLVSVTIFAYLVPPLAKQVYLLLQSIDLPVIDHLNSVDNLTELSELAGKYSNSVNTIFSFITSTFASIFTFFTLIVMSFYLILDRPKLHLKLYWFTKDKKKIKIAQDFLDSIESQLGGWVRGQIILMTIIGLATFLGLTVLKVPFALPLALLAGLLEILPNLGPTIAAVPAVALAFINLGPARGLATLIFYIIVQQVENNFIVPKIMKENADVNPLVAITCILIGFKIYSVVGALLAIPVYIILRTLYSFWAKYKKNIEAPW